jgi:hypothetical protein
MFQIWPKKRPATVSKDEEEETPTYRKDITRLQHINYKMVWTIYYVLTIHAPVIRLGQKW